MNTATSHENAPHSEVMKLCVIFFMEDIKGSQNELERALMKFDQLSSDIRGIDYSAKLGIDVSTTNRSLDRLIDRLEAYNEYLDVCEQVLDKVDNARELIFNVNNGHLLWSHYIDGVRWNVLALRERVSVRTIYRERDKAIKSLYYVMPEYYRRYAFPNALIGV